jgi:uncharacterized protein (DUF362 family)
MNSKVSIVKTDDITKSVTKAIELVGGLGIKEGDTVVIKPNAKHQIIPGYGVVTDPRIVDAVIGFVYKYKPSEIKIAEGACYPSGAYDTISAFQSTGIMDIAKKWDLELVDLNSWDSMDIDLEEGLVLDWVRVGRSVIEADYIINIPVLKTHGSTLVTACLKNIGLGCAVREEKKRIHRLGLDGGIVDVYSIVKPSFNIVDAIVALEGDGPNFPPGKPKPMGLVIAGSDGLAVDAVCCNIMGIDPMKVKHLMLAKKKGLGSIDLQDIDIVGIGLNEAVNEFELPSTFQDSVRIIE